MFDGCAASVRLARPEDETELIKLCRARHGEETLRNFHGETFAFSEEKCRRTLQRAIISHRNEPDAPHSWCAVIGPLGGALEASVYLAAQTTFDSDDTYLAEVWSYIYPDYRRSDNGNRLETFAKALAHELKMPIVSASYSDDEDNPKARFYRRSGRKYLGGMYFYSSQVKAA